MSTIVQQSFTTKPAIPLTVNTFPDSKDAYAPSCSIHIQLLIHKENITFSKTSPKTDPADPNKTIHLSHSKPYPQINSPLITGTPNSQKSPLPSRKRGVHPTAREAGAREFFIHLPPPPPPPANRLARIRNNFRPALCNCRGQGTRIPAHHTLVSRALRWASYQEERRGGVGEKAKEGNRCNGGRGAE